MHSRIVGAGRVLEKREMVLRRRMPTWALVFLHGGSGFYSDESRQQTVLAGDAILLFPELQHSYGPNTLGDWHESWLMFDGPLWQHLEDREGLWDRGQAVLHPGLDFGNSVSVLVAAVQDATPRVAGEDELLVARLHVLLAEMLARHRRGSVQAQDQDLVTRAQALLEAHLDRPLDLPGLARSLGVGYDDLRRRFTKTTGISPGKWLAQRRITRAQELLGSGLSIEATSERLGYCDVQAFSRQFRSTCGMPPGLWRGMQGKTTRQCNPAKPANL